MNSKAQQLLLALLPLGMLLATVQTTFAQVNNGLIAKYYFNSGNADDEVGDNDGTLVGAVSLTPDRFGNPNMAYKIGDTLNGSYITFGDSSEFRFGDGDFSISIWFRKDSLSQAGALIGKLDFFGSKGYGIDLGDSATVLGAGTWVRLALIEPGFARGYSHDVMDQGWHHAVIVQRYADSSSIYIDGQEVGSDTSSFSGNTDSFDIPGEPLILGRFTSGFKQYIGDADDVRIYNRALTDLEIDTLYNEPDPMPNAVKEHVLPSLNVFPNPAQEMIQISSDVDLKMVSVQDLRGKIVYIKSVSSRQHQIELSGLTPGLYVLNCQAQDGTRFSRRIIKE